MFGSKLRLARILALALLAAVMPFAAAQAREDIAALNQQVDELATQGKFKEAIPIAEEALSLAEFQNGEADADTLVALNYLAMLYQHVQRYDEAEKLTKRSLATCERLLGKDHPFTLGVVRNLGGLYRELHHYNDAEPLLKRALEGFERVRGAEHASTVTSIRDLAGLYDDQNRYAEAEALYRRAMAAQERSPGASATETFQDMAKLARILKAENRYAEAETFYKRAIEGEERTLGKENRATLTTTGNLAALYLDQSRYAEAELLMKRVTAAYERIAGPEDPDTLTSLNNLTMLYQEQGRYSEAEPLNKRVLETASRKFGEDSALALTALGNLASLYHYQGRFGEAEPLMFRVVKTKERLLGLQHPETQEGIINLGIMDAEAGLYKEAGELLESVAQSAERVFDKDDPRMLRCLNALAAVYEFQERYADAEPLHKRVLAAQERVLGPDNMSTIISVNNLAMSYFDQGRYAEALPLYKRALKTKERLLGDSHPSLSTALANLSVLYFVQSDWRRAMEFSRRQTDILTRRSQFAAQTAGQVLTGKSKSVAELRNIAFRAQVKIAYRLVPEGKTPDAGLTRETFQIAQWALGSEAARALAQMAARGAMNDPRLAPVVRERQDLLAEWQKLDGLRNAALARTTDKRDMAAEEKNTARLAVIETRVADLGKELAAKFPDYAAFASPAPLSVEEVQAQLGADEVLMLFVNTPAMKPAPEESFVWVVTKTEARWLHSDLGTEGLKREVQALRCGLDAAAWDDAGWEKCRGLVNAEPDRARDGGAVPETLPFDHARAHRLYKSLFGQAEDLIKGKQLLLVPSGPLTQLPLQVLVTAPPVNCDRRTAAWLIRDHALTVLPAVSSLKALRRVARPSAATMPLIGFGNPLLNGPNSRYAALAQRARDFRRCPETLTQRLASLAGLRGVAPVEMRGGLANVSYIRAQVPLPDTADELCAVAHDLHAGADDIRLGARASESEVKRLSASGELAKYRVIHFATHGALAGQITGSSEPGLILTPPDKAIEGDGSRPEDDGYLTASEIAGLKLDADWVILSACNTAAGDASEAQALSGLARAFFYAQTRALLVSHWAVDSNATVRLITGALDAMAQDRGASRAEALRRAMLTLIEKGEPREMHPAFWAPFVVVGEGGR